MDGATLKVVLLDEIIFDEEALKRAKDVTTKDTFFYTNSSSKTVQ